MWTLIIIIMVSPEIEINRIHLSKMKRREYDKCFEFFKLNVIMRAILYKQGSYCCPQAISSNSSIQSGDRKPSHIFTRLCCI